MVDRQIAVVSHQLTIASQATIGLVSMYSDEARPCFSSIAAPVALYRDASTPLALGVGARAD